MCGVCLLAVSCSESGQDGKEKEAEHKLFLQQKKLAANRADKLFSVFDQNLSKDEKEALEFLYAYMPLSDLANYDQEFFLSQVRYALKTRTEFSWGKTVPDKLFFHFVLPYRINNEDLDSARMVFFHELKDRIKSLSMYDAALEVNHWCHEKVSYHSADIRTSGPLSTVRTAYGRCGEESTFTVTAMRAVGIPARQVYTPRWAHSDDNHAWVEVWVDGKWYFLGACEPQPALNMGWFAGPATRAMLLNSKVFGVYNDEDIVKHTDKYTELDLITNYAPAKRLFVKVVTKDGVAVENAKVEFQLYNYAEFYPLAKFNTGKNGLCSLLTGYGDLVIWASKDNKVACKKVSVAKVDTLELTLGKYSNVIHNAEFALVPPPVGEIAEATEEGVAENSRRLHQEDSIRTAYENTFIDSLSIVGIAEAIHADNNLLYRIFKESRGNWMVIRDFVNKYAVSDKEKTLALLDVISRKDRRDVRFPVLVDHFSNSSSVLCSNKDEFYKYVLNPRISNELLTAYKKSIQEYFGEDFIKQTRNDVSILLNWVKDSIKVIPTENTAGNPGNPMFPEGLLELKVADKYSRDIFTVAALRSFGIPSRLEAARKMPQLLKNDKWIDLSFETLNADTKPSGVIKLTWNPTNKKDKTPRYYLQFTIAKFNGTTFRTLDYEFNNIFESFPAKLTLETGQYVITTGVRESTGTVWVKRSYFTVQEDKEVVVPIQFAKPQKQNNNSITKVDLNYTFLNFTTNNKENIGALNGKEGMVLIWLDPDREPTKHLINDLKRLKDNYESWKGKLVLAIEPQKQTAGFNLEKYKQLPNNTIFLKDTEAIREQFLKDSKCTRFKEYPMVFVVNGNGELIYSSCGYKIGIGDEILSRLNNYCLTN